MANRRTPVATRGLTHVALESGEFVAGAPYVFCTDPDGYVVELWYEAPTPYDPKTASRKRKVGR